MKLKSILLSIILGLGSLSLAHAADMPMKADPSIFNGYPATNGLYFGLYTIAGGGSANVSAAVAPGVNVNSLVTNQIEAGGLIGYAWNSPSSAYFLAVEAMFGWDNFNGSAPGLSLSGPADFQQRFMVGAPLAQIASVLPLSLPTVPPFPALANGATVTNIKPYIFGAIREQDVSLNFGAASNTDWEFSPGFGVGALGQWTNGIVIDVFAEMLFPQKGQCVGSGIPSACGGIGTQYLAGLAVKF